ncbi:MAG: TRL-like family protein [Verrucomicrobiia bacterium]|jgi:hypothetical protein
MKRLIVLVAMASAVVVFMSGCAMLGGVAGGSYAGIYTQTEGPVAVGSAAGSEKVGTATSTAIVFFATGDASIKAAMENGGITKIHHVDYKVMSVMGVYAKYTTVVYGE